MRSIKSLKDLFETLINADLSNLLTIIVGGAVSVFAIVGVFIIIITLFGFASSINEWAKEKRKNKDFAQKRNKYRNYH